MEFLSKPFKKIDSAIIARMAAYGITYLRVSLSLIFIWFGALKFFPDLSPTLGLIERTTEILTFGNLPTSIAIYILATSTPIILLPDVVFDQAPFALTMESHHIAKNLVLICA